MSSKNFSEVKDHLKKAAEALNAEEPDELLQDAASFTNRALAMLAKSENRARYREMQEHAQGKS